MKQFAGGHIAALWLLPILLSPALIADADASSNGRKTSKAERSLLAAAAAGDQEMTLLIAARRGRTSEVAGLVSRLGGSVAIRDNDVDYLRVVVPRTRVKELVAGEGIEAVGLDGVAFIDDPDPAPAGQADPSAQPAPGPDTPAVNPYLPTGDIGAPQFVEAHPTWDGRGTTIGIVTPALMSPSRR